MAAQVADAKDSFSSDIFAVVKKKINGWTYSGNFQSLL